MRIYEWTYLFCGSQGYLFRFVSGAHHSTRVAEKLSSVTPLQRTIIDIPYRCCHRNQRVVCAGIYLYTSYLTRKHKSRAYKRNCLFDKLNLSLTVRCDTEKSFSLPNSSLLPIIQHSFLLTQFLCTIPCTCGNESRFSSAHHVLTAKA